MRVTHTSPFLSREELEEQFRVQAKAFNLDVDVLSDGPLSAEVALVGEGLGESEIRYGRPFAGGSGRVLFDCLRPYGVHRANCYITNVVKRQVSLSRTGDEKHIVHRDELLHWTGLLHWELEQLPNLRTVFVMGNFALEALTGDKGVTNWRGSVVKHKIGDRTVTLVITINPAYTLRDLRMEPVFQMDCQKLGMVINNTFKEHHVEALINPSYKHALDFIRSIKHSPKPFAFDVEMISLETACFGLSNDPHVGMCINLRDASRNRFSLQEEADILLAIQDLCDSHRGVVDGKEVGPALIAQNGQFDAYWTRLHDYLAIRVWFDTLLAHHTLYPQLPHSLAFQVAQYTTHPYYKDEGKFWKEGGDIDQYWRYNCKDDALTVAVYLRELEALKKQGLDRFYFDHVMRAQPHLVSATVHGVAIDKEVKEKLVREIGEDVGRIKARFYAQVHEATGDDEYFPSPDSPKQLKQLFFGVLNLKGRGTSTDEMNRNIMIKSHSTPPIAKEMLTTLGEYKEQAKFLSTYAESRPSEDGRFRCQYNQYGVQRAPGRLSSSQLLDGTGGNMQNQPVRARAMFISDPNTVFIYFDLSQAEARVVAYRAKIEKWKEQFEQARKDGKYDCHRALASDMFKIPYEEVPYTDWVDDQGRNDKDPNFDPNTAKATIRYKSKRCRHGLNYEMEEWMLSQQLGTSYYEARKLYTIYHNTTPELRVWWEQEKRQFRKTKEQWNAIGRRNKIIQRLDDDAMESVIAFYPQSTIGDKIVQVWYQAEEDDQWPWDARVAIDVHDNLVGIATPECAKSALSILKRYAESPIMVQDAWGGKTEPLIIPAECKISIPDENGLHRWSKLKTVEL
jgi:uracil-DNA glycosylase family 4